MPQKKLRKEEFVALKRHWYQTLKLGGFKDIENERGNFKIQNKTPRVNEARAAYYRRCGWFLHEYSFQNMYHKKIWQLHCEGLGRDRIAKQMPRFTPDKIRLILEKLNEAMSLYVPDVDDES